MTRTTWAVIVLLAAGVATADEPSSPADKLATIKKRVANAGTEYEKAAQSLPDSKEGQAKSEELWQAFDKTQTEGFASAVELAKADPKSAAGFAALEWVLSKPRAYYVAPGLPAMELATEHHAANPKVGKVVTTAGAFLPDEDSNLKEYIAGLKLIRAVVEMNPDRTTRGQAVLALARQTKVRFGAAEYLKLSNADDLAAEAEREFIVVEKDYGDCKLQVPYDGETRSLGDVARPNLFELRSLRIGKLSPEIDHTDLGGEKFKLSDHRDKVVLLVFWASWCGPCLRAVPHERELVEKFKGRPFVLIGVNGDETIADAIKAVESAKINWRSFWNGEKGPQGAIAAEWNVRGWPTVYVIDHAGVIREKYLHGDKLDGPLEKLVAEAERAAK